MQKYEDMYCAIFWKTSKDFCNKSNLHHNGYRGKAWTKEQFAAASYARA